MRIRKYIVQSRTNVHSIAFTVVAVVRTCADSKPVKTFRRSYN